MINTASALTFSRVGDPHEVLQLEQIELPSVQPNEVLVKMHCAPINPADFNVIEGTYARKPQLPAVGGMEGVGSIVHKGVAVPGLKLGQQVIAPGRMGTWCDAYVARGDEVIPVPPGVDKEQASMLAVNPATALRMLEDFGDLKPGDWVIQNAANSGVGRCVIQIARSKWIKTVNIVRRPELIEPLKELGADVVVVGGPEAADEVFEATGGASIRLGLNATGGALLKSTVQCMAAGSTLVTYGAMSREPFTLGNGHLIFRDLRVRGFWITHWYQNANQVAVKNLFSTLSPMLREGRLRVPVEQTYALRAWEQALEHAARPGRDGKILFAIS